MRAGTCLPGCAAVASGVKRRPRVPLTNARLSIYSITSSARASTAGGRQAERLGGLEVDRRLFRVTHTLDTVPRLRSRVSRMASRNAFTMIGFGW